MRRMAYISFVVLSCKERPQEYFPSPSQASAEPVRTYAPMIEPKSAPAIPPAPTQKPETQDLKKDPGCKDGMARVGNFCIDRFEIVLENKDGVRFRHNMHPPEHMSGLMAVSAPGVTPQGHLSGPQAKKACQGAGKRLCTSEEWETACKGGGNPFPYGAVMDGSKCNVNKREPHILDYYFPDIPHLQRTGKQFNDPLLLLDPAYQTRTGQMDGCVTKSGVYDMDGNMSEWVSDTLIKGNVTYGTFRGAPFSGYANEGCQRKTTAHDERYYDYSLGTRCCAEK